MKPLTAALGVALVGLVASAAPLPVKADDTATLIVGQWVITKSSGDAPEGTVVDFTKDGKVKVVIKMDPKELTIEGKYTLEKDKLTMELKAGDMEVKEVLTIKKLTAEDLELKDKDDKVDVLKKKK